MLPPFLITRGLKLSARNHGATKTSTELSSVVLFPLHNSNFLYQIENLVSPPFRTATLVENETMEGQIGEGCPARIKVSLRIEREEVMILSSSFDRPNVYQQTQRLRSRVDVWYAKYDFRKRDLDPKDASASKNKTSSNASTGFYSSQPVM